MSWENLGAEPAVYRFPRAPPVIERMQGGYALDSMDGVGAQECGLDAGQALRVARHHDSFHLPPQHGVAALVASVEDRVCQTSMGGVCQILPTGLRLNHDYDEYFSAGHAQDLCR